MSEAIPCQSCGGGVCCDVSEQVAIKINLEGARTLEDLIALFQSIISPQQRLFQTPFGKCDRGAIRQGQGHWACYLITWVECFQWRDRQSLASSPAGRNHNNLFSRRTATKSRCVFITMVSKRENGRENTMYSIIFLAPYLLWECKYFVSVNVTIAVLIKNHYLFSPICKNRPSCCFCFCVSCRNKGRCLCVHACWGMCAQ